MSDNVYMINDIDAYIREDILWNHDLKLNYELLNAMWVVYHDRTASMSFYELVNLARFAQKARGLDGDVAELGVFKGGSAKLVASIVGEQKKIHLFDTFEGIPEVTAGKDTINVGDISHPFELTQAYLEEYKNISYYKGFFPDTAQELGKTGVRFSLVNLDADTYATTLRGLEFFYPRMVRRGIICVHDYQSLSCPGVKQAVDEFFADKDEVPVELWHTQAMVSKL